eukprot:TRINITY_DN10047_c0_g1_i2.p1 TRINITY_DN10047_c0_g1~~TRINITY_DN10047_c0_g1_i2.p1  ORF type:complete len:154 (+),score=20.58 TRINITY_DN10047_c0_g1_i2:1-462(+)
MLPISGDCHRVAAMMTGTASMPPPLANNVIEERIKALDQQFQMYQLSLHSLPYDRSSVQNPQAQVKYGSSTGEETLIVKGLPIKLSQKHLVDHLDRYGLKERYNFCHLPLDNTGLNRGFAIINFTESKDAQWFWHTWGKRGCVSSKTWRSLSS